MEPADALIEIFGVQDGSVITVTMMVQLEFNCQFEEEGRGTFLDVKMLVLPESKYDPTQTFSKYYPAPCDWASSHNRKGPSQYATWTYKEDATCLADQLLYAAKAQPEKAAQ